MSNCESHFQEVYGPCLQCPACLEGKNETMSNEMCKCGHHKDDHSEYGGCLGIVYADEAENDNLCGCSMFSLVEETMSNEAKHTAYTADEYILRDTTKNGIADCCSKATCSILADKLNAHDRLKAEKKKLLEILQRVVEYHEWVSKECIWHLEANAQIGLVRLLDDTKAIIAIAKAN